MAIDISGRRIFLASPGDLANERKVCRDTIQRFNEEHANENKVHFMVRGWEQVAPGLGRPQGKINPRIDDCDFMILVLGQRWGSPPALEGPYSSGTEEEFHRCLELLETPDAMMRDLVVIFKTIDPDRLRDPGPQLEKVISFRSRLEESKEVLFTTFDSEQGLETAINRVLADWSEPLVERSPKKILIPENVASNLTESDAGAGGDKLLEAAEGFVDQKLWMQAERAFSVAISEDSPIAITKYANFMRRTGRLETAIELNEKLLGDPKLLSRTDSEAISFRVNSLTSMGLIHRKRGALAKSAKFLREAIDTAAVSPEPLERELCKAYDNYGHTLLRLGENAMAIEQFQQSYKLRKDSGVHADIAQSTINIGRSHMADDQNDEAEQEFREALTILGTDPGNRHLKANALAGIAESRLNRQITDEVASTLDDCLELNQAINNSDGRSIAHGLYARLLLTQEKFDDAHNHAVQALEESEASGNIIGMATARLRQAQVAFARGESDAGQDLLVTARALEKQAPGDPLAAEISATESKYLDA